MAPANAGVRTGLVPRTCAVVLFYFRCYSGGCFDLTRSFVIVALALFTLRRAGLVVCVQ
jgi:hypothetical protein